MTSLFFLAQAGTSSPSDAEAAAGAAGCLACGGFSFLLFIGLIVLNIALLVWVARDAKSRGMDGAVLWMLLVFFTSFIGLIIYLLARPQGAVKVCRANHGTHLLRCRVFLSAKDQSLAHSIRSVPISTFLLSIFL